MSSINLSLTDELRSFIDSNCGDNGLYSTPSEFLRDILREKKERQELATLREGVLAGYQDLNHGRFVEFTGNLRESLKLAEKREQDDWK